MVIKRVALDSAMKFFGICAIVKGKRIWFVFTWLQQMIPYHTTVLSKGYTLCNDLCALSLAVFELRSLDCDISIHGHQKESPWQ